jgi:hypothetical protein
MPHSIIHGDACFAYFNKIRDIPGGAVAAGITQIGCRKIQEGRPIVRAAPQPDVGWWF